MHLVINATEIGRQRGGNESYLAGLIAGLAELAPSIRISLLTCEWGKPLSLPNVFEQVNVGLYRRLPFLLWQQTRVLCRLKADWYVSTFFLPPALPCRGAVLVHDLSFRAHPEYFPRWIAWYMRWLTGFAVWRSRRVVALSRFTRQELGRFHPRSLPKTVVVYPGIDGLFQLAQDVDAVASDAQILQKYSLEAGYILAVGNIHPRKNLARLLNAYRELRQSRDQVPPMVWVGLRRWDSGDLVDQALAEGVLLPGFIAQEDLPALYRQAMMLVYPSLYEGFGLPPVEAMACGTPVVTSKTTSLPEAVGQAALMVDPTSEGEIALAMARLLDDRDLCREMSEQGVIHAGRFTWKNTARVLLSALEID